MKNIRILYWITLILTILIAISAIVDTIFFIKMKSTFEPANENTYLGYYSMFVNSFLKLFLIVGLFYVQRSLGLFLKDRNFNITSTKHMKTAGLFIAMYGLAYIVFQINFINSAELSALITNIVEHITVILIGFGVYSFSEILKRGELIQQENDLTI